MGGVLRGIAGVLVYLGGLLFYAVRFLLFAVLCGALFGGAVYWAALKFSAPGSITRGLFDAIIVFISPIIGYTIVREKSARWGECCYAWFGQICERAGVRLSRRAVWAFD